MAENGDVELRGNWLQPGWVNAIESSTGVIQDLGGVSGADIGFVDAAGHDFRLVAESPCIDAAVDLEAEGTSVDRSINNAGLVTARPYDGALDCGAYEYTP